ncbi:serine hydrolase domain-containing protein [Aeromicrobium sp. P5_D10]
MRMRAVILSLSLLAITACSGEREAGQAPTPAPRTTTATPIPTPPHVFPGAEWSRSRAGDWSDLDATLAQDGSTCLAVIKDGVLVHEAYWNGGGPDRPQKVYSITKSMTSLLIGMAVDRGALDLDGPETVTLRSLLSMTSGRHWDEAMDRRMIRAEPDKSAYAVDVAQDRAPGRSWIYDNTAIQALEAVLDDLDESQDVVALAKRHLLEPLGMQNTTWGRDAAGNALTFSGVESTCQDLARVGHLMLSKGSWKGERLLSADYVRQATAPSSTLNSAFGLLWWTNAKGRVVEVLRQAGFATDKAPYEGRIAPNVPGDAYWAFGYGNQYIAVVPSEGVVAVRLGRRPASPDRVTFDSFTAGTLAALRR